ncbi:MAG: transcription termination factor Rho [Pirellulales bacterium]
MSTTFEPSFNHVFAENRARAGPETGRRKRRKSRPERTQHQGALEHRPPTVEVGGVLELHPKGYGFLRDPSRDLQAQPSDTFVPTALISRYELRVGAMVHGLAENLRNDEGPQLRQIEKIDGLAPEESTKTRHFDALTPVTPEHWLRLETGAERVTTRAIDLLTPLGKGQRALIVAPPRTGKTVLLQQIGEAILSNHADVKLMVLLVDERPEEVTDVRRALRGADVFASSLDRDVTSHVRLSQLVIERAKRLAEQGRDVFVIVDSITRMARAFNKWVGGSGRTMSGGLDVKALDIPKKLFASARAFEEGGSLTIVATALIETGSRMDELIFQEFKGTGNMEIVLDRRLADRRIWPAIDIGQSGTRREEKLFDAATLDAVTRLRRMLSSMNDVEAMEQLTKTLAKFKSNRDVVHYLSGSSRN